MKKLSTEQLATLEGYERLFHQAVDARYCSYPGADAIDKMLAVWNDVTGEGRRLRPGCSNCIFHLVQDLGNLYFAQKIDAAIHEAELRAEAQRQAAEDRAAFDAYEKAKAEPKKAPAKRKRTVKAK